MDKWIDVHNLHWNALKNYGLMGGKGDWYIS